jgi:hypothetical protein
MHFSTIVFALFSVASAIPADLLSRTSCSTPDGAGTCMSTSSCSGFAVAGHCPGAANIQCCVEKTCSTPSGSGNCKNTGHGCSGGSFIAGHCPGASDIQCCVQKSSTPSCSTPSGSGVCKSTGSGCSGGSFIPGYCPGPASEQCCVQGASGGGSFNQPISRNDIMSRGEYWISRHVPYSMTSSYPDPEGTRYRTDCSGFVSMAAHMSPPGLTTTTLLGVVNKISWDDLQPGDFVGTLGAGTGGTGGHVTLFKSWVNANTKKEYNSLECRGKAWGCIAYQRPIAWTEDGHVSAPYRYTHVK